MRETQKSFTINVDRAAQIVKDTVPRIGEERAGIINAFGRVLRQPVTAPTDLPECDIAGADGYAASSAETAGATDKSPRSFSILAESGRHIKHIESGTVLPIRQGDPLPEGADAVIEISRTYRPMGDPQVMVFREFKRGENVRQAGCRVSVGDRMISEGTVIACREMAVLASLGIPGVMVSRRPKVAVITTGSRIVDIIENAGEGRVRNSARYTLVGMLLAAGCELGKLIHVREGRIPLEKTISDCGDCAAVIVAVGPGDKHDSAAQALRNTGEIHFERVHMEPAMASAFGTVNNKPVFVLPADAVVESFEALIRPGLQAMLGRTECDRPLVRAKIQSTLKLSPGSRHFLKAHTEWDGEGYVTKPIASSGAEVRAFAAHNSLVVVGEDIETIKRGEIVDVRLTG